MPKQAISDEEIRKCFPVMAELRPNLEKHTFLNLVRQMEREGFRLAYLEEKSEVVAVAGYRMCTSLFMGKHLYIDDLVTTEKHRSKGYGKKLLGWLRSIARENECKYLHLDSGTQRHQAHKFYFRQGFVIASYHFAEEIKAAPIG